MNLATMAFLLACAGAGVTMGATLALLLHGTISVALFVFHLAWFALACWVTLEVARWSVEQWG